MRSDYLGQAPKLLFVLWQQPSNLLFVTVQSSLGDAAGSGWARPVTISQADACTHLTAARRSPTHSQPEADR